jgi:hypothetical protein
LFRKEGNSTYKKLPTLRNTTTLLKERSFKKTNITFFYID